MKKIVTMVFLALGFIFLSACEDEEVERKELIVYTHEQLVGGKIVMNDDNQSSNYTMDDYHHQMSDVRIPIITNERIDAIKSVRASGNHAEGMTISVLSLKNDQTYQDYYLHFVSLKFMFNNGPDIQIEEIEVEVESGDEIYSITLPYQVEIVFDYNLKDYNDYFSLLEWHDASSADGFDFTAKPHVDAVISAISSYNTIEFDSTRIGISDNTEHNDRPYDVAVDYNDESNLNVEINKDYNVFIEPTIKVSDETPAIRFFPLIVSMTVEEETVEILYRNFTAQFDAYDEIERLIDTKELESITYE